MVVFSNIRKIIGNVTLIVPFQATDPGFEPVTIFDANSRIASFNPAITNFIWMYPYGGLIFVTVLKIG